MILPYQEIALGGFVQPLITENINAASINLTISDTVKYLPDDTLIDTSQNLKNLPYITEKIPQNGYILKKGKGYLISTREIVSLPNDVAAEISLRSSAARIFINHLKAGYIDPGFIGNITLEFICAHDTRIYANESKLVQLILYKLTEPTLSPYKGVYQHQKGVTPIENAKL